MPPAIPCGGGTNRQVAVAVQRDGCDGSAGPPFTLSRELSPQPRRDLAPGHAGAPGSMRSVSGERCIMGCDDGPRAPSRAAESRNVVRHVQAGGGAIRSWRELRRCAGPFAAGRARCKALDRHEIAFDGFVEADRLSTQHTDSRAQTAHRTRRRRAPSVMAPRDRGRRVSRRRRGQDGFDRARSRAVPIVG